MKYMTLNIYKASKLSIIIKIIYRNATDVTRTYMPGGTGQDDQAQDKRKVAKHAELNNELYSTMQPNLSDNTNRQSRQIKSIGL
jgi:hypothetical protein